MVFELILKGKMKFHQLAGIEPAEIELSFANAEIALFWAEKEYWQRAYSDFLGEINNKYPQSKRLQFIKRTNWILPHRVKGTPISGVPTFYIFANKSGKAVYKSGKVSKVAQSPYDSVKKSRVLWYH